jgi:hypothetical protein
LLIHAPPDVRTNDDVHVSGNFPLDSTILQATCPSRRLGCELECRGRVKFNSSPSHRHRPRTPIELESRRCNGWRARSRWSASDRKERVQSLWDRLALTPAQSVRRLRSDVATRVHKGE